MRKVVSVLCLSAATSMLAALLLLWPSVVSAQPEAPSEQPEDPVVAAQRLFDDGEFAAGRKVLNDACQQRRRDHGEYARLLLALADFYERYVGDHRYVRGYLKEILKLSLPPDSPQLAAARQIRRRLDALAARFKEQDALLARAKVARNDRESLEQQIAQLTAVTTAHPDYPQIAAAYHYLGESRLKLGQYRLAYRAFTRALELRPAIMFSLPTAERRSQSFERWVREDLSLASWISLGVLGLLSTVLLFASKPWRHLRLNHGLVLLTMVLAWWAFYRLSVFGLDLTVHEPKSYPAPVVTQTGFGSPLSQSLDTLFYYGLTGVVGAFVIALSTMRLRPRWTWTFITGTAVVVMFACLMTQFVLRHGHTAFETAEHGRYPYLRGDFHYPVSTDLDPFLLSDPMAYCQLHVSIDNMDEEELKTWFASFAERCKR